MSKLIELLFAGIEHALALIEKYRAAAQQSGEWTPEAEATYKARRDALMAQPHWKIDP